MISLSQRESLALRAARCALQLPFKSILLCHCLILLLPPMSHSADEGELSGHDKQEVFQDLLSGSEYVLFASSIYIFC